MALWSFASEFEASRATKLLALSDFDEVLALIDSAVVVGFRWKDFENERLRGCFRAEYALKVHEDTYDAIFNAPVGLRAQYARGAAHGEAANRRIIALLGGRLVAYSDISANAPPRSRIEWSLCGSQAKIWIDEVEAEEQLGVEQPQILYEPWARNSKSGVGLLAPRATRLEVKGGWLRSDGIVVIDPAKLTRSDDIHREGYS